MTAILSAAAVLDPVPAALDPAPGLPATAAPAAPSRAITAADVAAHLDHGVPVDYHGAELPVGLRRILHEWPRSLLLHGPPGTGKTWLCWAMLRSARRRRGMQAVGQVVAAARLEDGFDRQRREHRPRWGDLEAAVAAAVRAAMGPDRVRILSESADLRRHRHDRDWLDEAARWGGPHDVLCVDDIGFTGRADDWVQEAVYHLANLRRQEHRPTLWTTNLDPEGLRAVFGPAIASRLAGGVVVPVDGPDRRLDP